MIFPHIEFLDPGIPGGRGSKWSIASNRFTQIQRFRGKYASRFNENRDEFLSAAAAMDRQALAPEYPPVSRLDARQVP